MYRLKSRDSSQKTNRVVKEDKTSSFSAHLIDTTIDPKVKVCSVSFGSFIPPAGSVNWAFEVSGLGRSNEACRIFMGIRSAGSACC